MCVIGVLSFASCLCCVAAKGGVNSPEVRNQLEDAAHATSKAFAQIRGDTGGADAAAGARVGGSVAIDDMDKAADKEEQKISLELAVMQPILRFLQLLCENHNRDLQVCVCA